MSLYSPDQDPKYQRGDVVRPSEVAAEVLVSPDTLRENRIPDGQHRTRKWPVLHATSVPVIVSADWKLTVTGLVTHPFSLNLEEFQRLPRTKVFADFHCVTAWSRLGNLWEGVSAVQLLQRAGMRPEAKYAIVGGCDGNWTTNLPLAEILQNDVLLADTHDEAPLDADHGGPVRLVVPRLFAWKSAKWINSITLTENDQSGYWERRGYHDLGDPWQQQRYRED